MNCKESLSLPHIHKRPHAKNQTEGQSGRQRQIIQCFDITYETDKAAAAAVHLHQALAAKAVVDVLHQQQHNTQQDPAPK